MNKVDLHDKFDQVTEYWSPKIIGELNGQLVKIAKVKGEFIWHHHEQEDELFLVVKGCLKLEFRDKTIELQEQQIMVVPRGVEHKPAAAEETWIVMFEPASTLNTGNIVNERTKNNLDII